jgi:ketosteroid isomerase-like protein
VSEKIGIVERGYGAADAGDADGLREVFAEDAVWELMRRTEVARSYNGRDSVVEFLLGFEELRLESIMELDEIVVAAHSFAVPGGRAVATTVYRFRDGLVVSSNCADVRRRAHRGDLSGYLPGAETAALGGQETAGAGGDIDALVFSVMMDAASDAEADLRLMMKEIQSINAAKRRMRDLICKVRADIVTNTKVEPDGELSFASGGLGSEESYHQAPLPVPDPGCAGGVQTVVSDLYEGPITQVEQLRLVREALEAKLDSMSEMSEMTSLRLQMMMDRRSKFISTLSNIMKKVSTTQDTLIQNLK